MIKNLISITLIFILYPIVVLGATNTSDTTRYTMNEIQEFLFVQQHDTSYIANYNDQLALRFVMNRKLNYFNTKDKSSNEGALFRPNRGLNLGIGASYRWFALDLVFSTNLWQDDQLKDSKSRDFQGRVYTNKHFIEAKMQYYDGYTMDRVYGESSYDNALREDIRTLNLGLQYLFAFNYLKFSFKAPFVLSEVQKKSAGSVIAGAGFNLYTINGDSSIIPLDAVKDINPSLMYDDMMALNLSVKLGYMYTHVLKGNYFVSLGAIPGIGYTIGDYRVNTRESLSKNLTWNFKGLATVGYNADVMFYGLQYILDVNTIKQDYNARTMIGGGKISVLIGYRFDVKKIRRNIRLYF